MGIAGLKRGSIFVYVGAVFAIAALGLNGVAFGVFGYLKNAALYEEHQIDVKALRLIESVGDEGGIEAKLLELGVSLVGSKEEVLKKAKTLESFAYGKSLELGGSLYSLYYKLPPPVKPSFPIPLVGSLFDESDKKPNKKAPPNLKEPILLKKLGQQPNDYFDIFVYSSLAANLALAALFWLIIRKLLPILHLRETIKRFGEGDLNARSNMMGGDEIAFVGAEFDKSAERIKELLEARALLVRNLLHELKTPVTTAKLTTALIKEERLKNRLEGSFDRMERVIEESVWVERLAGGVMKPSFAKSSLIDLAYEALELLDAPQERVSIVGEGLAYCDNRLAVIAIKNLIDNALKYSKSDVKISIDGSQISIISVGEPLEREFESYLVPFCESKNKKSGLGLGLWIVYRISKLHGGDLRYIRKEGMNIFALTLPRNQP